MFNINYLVTRFPFKNNFNCLTFNEKTGKFLLNSRPLPPTSQIYLRHCPVHFVDTYSTVVAGDKRSGIRSRLRNIQRTVVLKHIHLAGHSATAVGNDDNRENANSISSGIVSRKTAAARRR